MRARGPLAPLRATPLTRRWMAVALLLVAGIALFAPGAFGSGGEEGSTLLAVTADEPVHLELDPERHAIIELVLRLQGVHLTHENASQPQLSLTIEVEHDDHTWATVGEPVNITATHEMQLLHHEFELFDHDEVDGERHLRLTITSDADIPVSLDVEAHQLSGLGRYRVSIAAIILVIVYVLIILEVVHRTVAACLGAFMALGAVTGIVGGPDLGTVVGWIDEGTIGLLLGMMVMVGIFSQTGFFEWAAVRAYKYSKGSVWSLVVILCTITMVLSAFLDNVTTMLLLAPVSLRLAKVLDIPPVPLLITEVMFSNIGGTATLIGDPPNIIIGSLLSDHITFLDFIINLAPGVLLAIIPAFLLSRWSYHDHLTGRREIDIGDLIAEYPIKDRRLFVICSVILGSVILLFFLHAVIHLDPAWAALLGAVVMLTVTSPHEIEHPLEQVEWSTLLFFAGLFVMVEGLAELGLIRAIGEAMGNIIGGVGEGGRLAVALLLIIWVSAIASAFIDNIPYTTTMVPVIVALAADPALGLPLKPLAWALAFGACLGGNGTLVGASANVLTAGIAEREGYPLSFNAFFKAGFPMLLLTVAIATVYMLVVYVWLGWGH